MKLIEKIRRLLAGRAEPWPATAPPAAPSLPLPEPISRRLLVVIHNPTIPSNKDRPLNQVLGWNDPEHLVQQLIDDLRVASHDIVRYEVVDQVVVDRFPAKVDGFAYTPDSYLAAWRRRSGFHAPDRVDYPRLLREFDVYNRIDGSEIDEVWLLAFPYAGYYESMMVGPDAFWCNAPPLADNALNRRFVVMGFNYERGVGEMLENFGHRAESIMSHVYRGRAGAANLWERFIRHERSHPGRAECGNVHFAPNSERDYDWGNPRRVLSNCDDWLFFPHLEGRRRYVNHTEWGNGEIRAHHLWWLQHLPHTTGETAGIAHNWWRYIIDPNTVR